jgi:hypothetical protein
MTYNMFILQYTGQTYLCFVCKFFSLRLIHSFVYGLILNTVVVYVVQEITCLKLFYFVVIVEILPKQYLLLKTELHNMIMWISL